MTLYLADYLIERFLKKFSDELNESIQKTRNAESVQTPNATVEFTDKLCAKLIMKQKSGMTWKKIADELNTTEDAVKSQVQRYKKRLEEKK